MPETTTHTATKKKTPKTPSVHILDGFMRAEILRTVDSINCRGLWATEDAIVKETGLTPKNVRPALAYMKSHGLIRQQTDTKGHNVYATNFDPEQAIITVDQFHQRRTNRVSESRISGTRDERIHQPVRSAERDFPAVGPRQEKPASSQPLTFVATDEWALDDILEGIQSGRYRLETAVVVCTKN